MPRLVLTFVVAAVVGGAVAHGLRPRADPAGFVRGVPIAGSESIEGRVSDPYGLPPGAPRGTRERGLPEPPPWAVLVWRDRHGRTCHEGGPTVDDSTPGRGDEIPGAKVSGSNFPEPLVGSLRPDSRSGTGIQFYDLGRFLGYPTQEGGSCGDPRAGAGLLVSLEHRFERRDLGPARTVVTGVAGPRVSAVFIGGRRKPLSRRRAFVALYDGIRWPVVRVVYRDARGRTLRFERQH